MAGYKAGRLSVDIQRIVSGLLRELKDPRIGGGVNLSVVRCEVAGDGSFCKIYISSLDGLERAKQAVKGLESATGFIKREISNVLHLRKSPDLKFIADDSIAVSAHINKLIKDSLPQEKTGGEES